MHVSNCSLLQLFVYYGSPSANAALEDIVSQGTPREGFELWCPETNLVPIVSGETSNQMAVLPTSRYLTAAKQLGDHSAFWLSTIYSMLPIHVLTCVIYPMLLLSYAGYAIYLSYAILHIYFCAF